MNPVWSRYRTSALIIASFLVFDLFMYATTHFIIWLYIAAFGVVRLGIIGWAVFHANASGGNAFPQGMSRMAQAQASPQQGWPQQQAPANWQQPIPPAVPTQTAPAPAAPVPPVPPPPPPGFHPPIQPSQPSSDAAPWNI